MTTIFQMNREDLVSLLAFLRPNLLAIQPNEHNHSIKATPTNISSFDCVRLRMLITEWLLLNGLSTLHKFERDFDYMDSPLVQQDQTDKAEIVPNGFHRPSEHRPALSISARSRNKDGSELLRDLPATKWKMPNKMDCISCGKFRVGRTLSVYGRKGVSKPPPTIVTEPVSQDHFNELILEQVEERKENGVKKDNAGYSPWDRQSPKLIKSNHGNLNQVHYYSSKTNGYPNGKTSSNPKYSRSHSFLNSFCFSSSTEDAGSFTKCSPTEALNNNIRTASPHISSKKVSSSRQLENGFSQCPEHKDRCEDMCLVCLFCECNAGSKRATRIK